MQPSTATTTPEAVHRAHAVDEARASSRLEGIDLDEAGQAVAQRYIDGKLNGEQLVEEMIRLPLA